MAVKKKRKSPTKKRKATARKRILAPVKRRVRRGASKARGLAKRVYSRARSSAPKADVMTLIQNTMAIVFVLLVLQKIKHKFKHKNKWIASGVPILAGFALWYSKFGKKNQWVKAVSASMIAGGAYVAISDIKMVKDFLYGDGGAENQTLAGYADGLDFDLTDAENFQLLGEEIYDTAHELEGEDGTDSAIDIGADRYGDSPYDDVMMDADNVSEVGYEYEFPADDVALTV